MVLPSVHERFDETPPSSMEILSWVKFELGSTTVTVLCPYVSVGGGGPADLAE
jgi:hypothetical protein